MNNAQLVIDEVKKAVKGKDDCIIKAFAAFLAGGHILLEDVPGVGKTTLAVAFSRAMALVNHRVQFTPDVPFNAAVRLFKTGANVSVITTPVVLVAATLP